MRMNQHQRERWLQEITELAPQALLGSLSETYRRCGNRKCRCHAGGSKHGPHLYLSYRGPAGKTTGYYVPEAAHAATNEVISRHWFAWPNAALACVALGMLRRGG